MPAKDKVTADSVVTAEFLRKLWRPPFFPETIHSQLLETLCNLGVIFQLDVCELCMISPNLSRKLASYLQLVMLCTLYLHYCRALRLYNCTFLYVCKVNLSKLCSVASYKRNVVPEAIWAHLCVSITCPPFHNAPFYGNSCLNNFLTA